MANPRLIPIRGTQEALGDVGRTTVYNLVDQGHLTKVNIGRRAFITAESIESYLDTLTGEAV